MRTKTNQIVNAMIRAIERVFILKERKTAKPKNAIIYNQEITNTNNNLTTSVTVNAAPATNTRLKKMKTPTQTSTIPMKRAFPSIFP